MQPLKDSNKGFSVLWAAFSAFAFALGIFLGIEIGINLIH